MEEGGMKRPRSTFPVVLSVAVLLAALATVTWRQSRSFEALASLDEVRRLRSASGAERVELERSIQVLESRGRVVPLARARLAMHTPQAAELVILPAEQGR
jgi:cell division protein FtsL